MQTFTLYVGADNSTGTVDHDTLRAVLDERHEGYTIVPALGRWKGKEEQSILVIIGTDDELAVNRTVTDLKDRLNQQSIGIQKTAAIDFV
jgi:hypothetical protein